MQALFPWKSTGERIVKTIIIYMSSRRQMPLLLKLTTFVTIEKRASHVSVRLALRNCGKQSVLLLLNQLLMVTSQTLIWLIIILLPMRLTTYIIPKTCFSTICCSVGCKPRFSPTFWIQEAQLSPSDRAMRLVIFPITTQQCRNYLYDKSWPNRWYDGGGLVGGNVS